MSLLRFIMLALILYFGVIALKIEYSVLQIGILDIFDDLPFIFLALLTTSVFFIDTKKFSENRRWYQLVSSIIGIFSVGIILKGKIERYATNTSPVVMLMHHIPGNYPVYTLELKKNGRFKLYNTEMFGQSIYYGDYARNGDSLLLVRYSYEDENKLPRIGFVRGDTVKWNDSITLAIERKSDRIY